MDERYGASASQGISDVKWIEKATANGDVLLSKDMAIARNPLEAAAIYRVSARAFALARQNIDGPSMARCLLANQQRIFRMAGRAAGSLCSLGQRERPPPDSVESHRCVS